MTLALERPARAGGWTAWSRRGAPGLEDLPLRLVPRTLFLLKAMDAHALWRTRWVSEELTRHGYTAEWNYLDHMENVAGLIQAGRYNVVVTPRLIFNNGAVEAERFRRLVHDDGMTWVYELDDEILTPAIVRHQLVSFDVCRQIGFERLDYERQQRIDTIERVDGVVTSTEPLAAVVRQYTAAPVHVVPNAIDVPWIMARVRDVERRAPDSLRTRVQLEPGQEPRVLDVAIDGGQAPAVTVGWAGGARSNVDLYAVAEAWRRIAERYPQVTFVVAGERMDVLMDAVPKGQRRRIYIPWVDLELYPKALPHIDIACCSVAPTEWNRCKSPDKFFEHTLAGASCVVSPALYGPVVTDGVDALVAETPDEWERALARLLDEPLLRWELNRAALETVAHHHSVQFGWPAWVRAFADILDSTQSNGRQGGWQYHAAPFG